MPPNDDVNRPAVSVLLWTMVLGGVGFVTGFFGPMVLSPDSNQGPMFGLFISGPGGALLGAVLGAVSRLLPISSAASHRLLATAATVLGIVTLYFCLPEPAAKGLLVVGQLTNCQPPGELAEAAIADWNESIAAAPWGKPRAGWQQDVARMLQDAAGVVLTIDVRRENRIFEHRKPWDAGRLSAGGWQPGGESRRYFADYAGSSCAAYTGDKPVLYVPYGQGTTVWPPDDLPNFLGLAKIEPAPSVERVLAAGP